MGYKKVPVIHTLTLKGYEGLEVRMVSAKVGKVRKLIRIQESEDERTDEMIDEVVGLIVENIVSWNMETEAGEPIPPTREEIEDLELGLILDLVGEWMDKTTAVSADLGKDSTSGPQFPAPKMTMEVLSQSPLSL